MEHVLHFVVMWCVWRVHVFCVLCLYGVCMCVCGCARMCVRVCNVFLCCAVLRRVM